MDELADRTDPTDDQPVGLPGKPWRPLPADPKSKRRIDSYDPAAFGAAPPPITDADVDRIVEATEPDFEVRPGEREVLREQLVAHITNFSSLNPPTETISVGVWRAPEVRRERSEEAALHVGDRGGTKPDRGTGRVFVRTKSEYP